MISSAELEHGFPIAVRRSKRARRVRLSVRADGAVEVTLPVGVSDRVVPETVRELRPWIDRRRRDLHAARGALERAPGTVPFLGETLHLVQEESRQRVHLKGNDLLVPSGDSRGAIELWYRRAARTEIEPRLNAACARAGASYTRLSIRAQKTRWGSCSSTGQLSFNWRLLLAPEEILEYVIEHEVCHLEIMDHSARFWALLEKRMPDCRKHAQWLRRYGLALEL